MEYHSEELNFLVFILLCAGQAFPCHVKLLVVYKEEKVL